MGCDGTTARRSQPTRGGWRRRWRRWYPLARQRSRMTRRIDRRRPGDPVDEDDALHRGAPRGDGEEDADRDEDPAVERETKEGLRRREERHALRALQDPHLRVDPEALGAGARIRGEERPDDPEEEHRDHGGPHERRDAVVHVVAGEEDREPAQNGAVGHAVERGIVEGAEDGGATGATRDGTVQNVEERGEAEDPPRRADVPGSVDRPRRHGTERPDGGDGVWVDPTLHHPVGDRLNELEVAADGRIPESFHAGQCGARAREESNGMRVETRKGPVVTEPLKVPAPSMRHNPVTTARATRRRR
jgi:hypothetical protein